MTTFPELVGRGETFQPDGDPEALRLLLDEVALARQCTLAALALQLGEKAPSAWARSGLEDSFSHFMALPPDRRARTAHDPVFLLWLRRAVREAAHHFTARSAAAGLESALEGFARVATWPPDWRAPPAVAHLRGSVEVRRFDVDALLAEAAPPTYTFPDVDRATAIDTASRYTLALFREAADAALRQVEAVWPELPAVFAEVVQMVVHVPDGEFRSASASRYTGVIFLSSDDASLSDIAESLVHELGHQLLYRVMELDPLVRAAGEEQFTLPWSGSDRDFYGYFHAFYIYVLLAKYYERRIAHPALADDADRARLDEILAGLERSIPDFVDEHRYTELGARFAASLRREASSIVDAGQEVTAR